ncbi:uncharacterized protein LY89DRAFT_677397 [Mollisia scopiformis]|uniref:Uncharacterized protein n=1 Tax=Mollisia scopiformis TaxID=149040 RepID=A0A132B6P1_MOLSC|nr:uncharacterized protein LY89DRAFT_677397 [Mollisia scopiformis]KUJ08076.1 hypothetical protein LY89DRAFT_677397 [Mollisia scopiformis]
MALCILKYQFNTFRRPATGQPFNLEADPLYWDLSPLVDGSFSNTVEDGVLKRPKPATSLLVAIMWSAIIGKRNPNFWTQVRDRACTFLFNMVNAPSKYLVWIQVIHREKTYFEDIEPHDGGTFFTVDNKENVEWIECAEGLTMSGQVIGELPPFYLTFIRILFIM